MAEAVLSPFEEQLKSRNFMVDPYPTYRALRVADPVHYNHAWGVWILTRYDDVVTALRDPQHFSNAGRYPALLSQLPKDVQARVEPLRRHNSAGMLQSDPPDHTRLRNLVRDSFSAGRIRDLRAHIQSIVDDLIDQFEPKTRFDVIRDLAFPLPVSLIAELLGVPKEDREQFLVWSEHVAGVQATGAADAEYAVRGSQAIQELEEYFRKVCFERRQHPRDDLISYMVVAQESGDKLSELELINMCVNFLSAGHISTKNLIGNGVLTLINHPEAREELERNPPLMTTAIEEMLRYESPIQRAWRRVAEDVKIRGKLIRAGDTAFLMLGSANRDPKQFQDPDRFDIRRTNNSHVAFGHGIHFCIGAPLARMEAPIALSTLLRRLPKLRLDKPVEWHEGILERGPRALHVAFDN